MIVAILCGLAASFVGAVIDGWRESKRAEKRYAAEWREHERIASEDREALRRAVERHAKRR